MSTRIGLIGDPHATPEPLAEALAILRREKVDAIWCPGDIAGYGENLDKTVMLLKDSSCRLIYGNHEQWYLEKAEHHTALQTNDYIKSLPPVIQEEIEGRRLYMVHASPPQSVMEGIRLLDDNGNVIDEEKQVWTERLAAYDHDVLIVGHTHQVFAEQLGHTLVINPGSTWFNHCCAVLVLPDIAIKWFALSKQAIRPTWHWGEEYNR
jgi:putative phosphoesterase